MPQLLDCLKQSSKNWLLGCDFEQLRQLTEQLYLQLSQKTQQGLTPKVIIAERESVKFLAGFIAATAASCPVFLCNPYWVQQEWQQVFKIVQPDLVLGYGDWGLEIKNYYPNSQQILNLAIDKAILSQAENLSFRKVQRLDGSYPNAIVARVKGESDS